MCFHSRNRCFSKSCFFITVPINFRRMIAVKFHAKEYIFSRNVVSIRYCLETFRATKQNVEVEKHAIFSPLLKLLGQGY